MSSTPPLSRQNSSELDLTLLYSRRPSRFQQIRAFFARFRSRPPLIIDDTPRATLWMRFKSASSLSKIVVIGGTATVTTILAVGILFAVKPSFATAAGTFLSKTMPGIIKSNWQAFAIGLGVYAFIALTTLTVVAVAAIVRHRRRNDYLRTFCLRDLETIREKKASIRALQQAMKAEEARWKAAEKTAEKSLLSLKDLAFNTDSAEQQLEQKRQTYASSIETARTNIFELTEELNTAERHVALHTANFNNGARVPFFGIDIVPKDLTFSFEL